MAQLNELDTQFSEHFDLFDERSHTPGANTDWAVPWSDLMMVMFVLFVVLYVYASTHQDVTFIFTDRDAPAHARHSSNALDGVIARMNDRMSGQLNGSQGLPGLANKEVFYKSKLSGVSVVREPSGVRVVLRGPDFFEQGKTELAPGGVSYLMEIAEILRLTQGEVQVIGFSDATEPSGVEGFTFSARRASSIAAYFIEQTQISGGRFSITGRGAYAPEVPSTTTNPDEINRRVEIVIHTG